MNKININSIIRKCSFLALAGLMASCVTDITHDDASICPQSTLTFNFTIPETTITRADNTVSATSQEAAVHNLKVWIFQNGGDGTDKAIAYKSLDPADNYQSTANNAVEFKIDIPSMYISSTCDLYVVANSDAIDAWQSSYNTKDVTRNTLASAVINKAPLTTSATKGLPMARIANGITVANFANTDTPVQLSLLRSVSKIGVYFTKSTELGQEVKVTGISISNVTATGDGGYVFPKAVDYTSATANATVSNIPSSVTSFDSFNPYFGINLFTSLPITVANINTSSSAVLKDALKWETGETGQQFKNKLLTWTTTSEEAYFLESNKPAVCTISYTINGKPATATLNLWTGNGVDLIRNHEVIIYGHFVGSSLYVQPFVLPWTAGETVDYDLTNIEASIVAAEGSSNKTITPSTYPATLTAYDATSSGDYYPQFTVKFTKPIVNRWLLQSTNPYFGFKINANDDIKDYIEGAGGSSVTFYVVPKNSFNAEKNNNVPSIYQTSLILTVPDLSSLGRISFNAAKTLPGTETEVYIQQVQQEDYK